MLGRRMYLPGNVDDLAQQSEQIWQKIPQETIRVLYQSMSRRVAAYIQAREESRCVDYSQPFSPNKQSLVESSSEKLFRIANIHFVMARVIKSSYARARSFRTVSGFHERKCDK
ncbi:hypothetical protein TNCV_154021 [Trichonephila clavipes]|nr:hypothetical protein TNCV_154021 [Trichonephila clavipes]